MILKQGQDIQPRLILRFLENILNKQQQDKEKERINNIIKKYERTRQKKDISGLSNIQGHMYILFQSGFNAYKESFVELLKQEKYKTVSETEGFNINEYLLEIQSNININKDAMTIDNLVSKYTVNMIKLKKAYPHWPKDMISDWSTKAKERLKKMEQRRQEIKEIKKRVPEPKVEKDSESDDNQSYVQKPKPSAQAYRPPPEREPERRIVPEKPRGRIDQRQTRFESARDKLMEKYLQSRNKDIHIEKAKMKEVAQFLASRLDHFMKKTVEKIIDVASLKNKKNPKLGNQVGYFSANSHRINPQNTFYYSANSKIYLMQYKHKLQIYTTLRSKELKKEDDLRSALESSTNENEKKVDKKIENYVLKPRPKQVEPIQIFKQDKDASKATSNQLLVSSEHALYYLQTHRYLRNSLLLFNAYHY